MGHDAIIWLDDDVYRFGGGKYLLFPNLAAARRG
jgi:hypothetical protein